MSNKGKREPKFEDFFRGVLSKQNVCFVDQLGLQDTNLNLTLTMDIELAIKELFIFTNDGTLVVNSKFHMFTVPNLTSFYSSISDIALSCAKAAKVNNNFNFNKVYLNNLKVVFLYKSHLILCGVFSEFTNSLLIKLYLTHIYMAFLNFNMHFIQIIKNKVPMDALNEIFLPKDMKSAPFKQLEVVDLNQFEFLPVKIFEQCFARSLTMHFDRVAKHILKKEEMYLSSIKFKNMYVLDLHTQEIMFDMMSMRKSAKNKKYYKNEKLWQEVLFHSNNLLNSYKNSIGMQSDANESTYKFFFVKFECTSTFPRLTFIIKFLPILKGVSIIHLYSTKKLSRNSDSNEGSIINKLYKEIDILYGTEIKNNPNIEFRYIEPTKLQEIERFFFEFYVSTSSSMDLFYDINHEIKYFDYFLLNKVGEILVHNKTLPHEIIIQKVIGYLFELHVKTKFNNLTPGEKPKTLNNPFHFMLLPKEQIVNEYFKMPDGGKSFKTLADKSANDLTLNLSKVEEFKFTEGRSFINPDNSFDVVNKVSFLSKEDDVQQPSFIIPVKAKITSTNMANFSQTIDYFVNEIGGTEKRVNGAEENGGVENRVSEHSSLLKNNKDTSNHLKLHNRSSSLNNKLTKKPSFSPVATPIPKENRDIFFAPGSPKFN